MKHKGLLIAFVALLFVAGAFFFGMLAYLFSSSSGRDAWHLGDAVGLITVNGAILSSGDIVEEIEDFRKDNDIRAVIVRLESPGGSVGSSQEIYEAVKRLAQKKPVVASMGSVAASGAYYVACGATKILANPGTVTGSIGVRMEHITIGDLLKWAKVGHETLKSGKFKDLTPIDRPMTLEEKAIVEKLLADLHMQFKEAVASSRGMASNEIDEIADGRIYTGRQALELKLIDALGGFTEAKVLAAKLGKIRGEPKIVEPRKKSRLWNALMDSNAEIFGLAQAVRSFDFWQPMMLMGH